VTVPSLRGMLGARSPVFRSMLFGNFSEATSSSVTLGYEGSVLRALVEYIYTDDCEVFHKKEFDFELSKTLVGLADAANYFGLPDLYKNAKDLAFSVMRSRPCLACNALSYLEDKSGVWSEMEGKIRQIIRSNASAILENEVNVISSLSASSLENILREDDIGVDDFTLFLVLEAWANNDGKKVVTAAGKQLDSSEIQNEDRRETAAQLTHYIRFSHIDPSKLSTKVQESGLVTTEQLCEAFKKQALHSERQLGRSFKKQKTTHAVWKTSYDAVLSGDDKKMCCEVMDCPAMRNGLHKWTIKLEQMSDNLVVGIASTIDPPDPTQQLGRDKRSWALWDDGDIWHAKYIDTPNKVESSVDLTFEHGSEVSLVLDLRGGGGGGTLSASVDDGPTVLLFSNLLSHLDNHGGSGGFVPAVEIYEKGDKVRLIEMHEIFLCGGEDIESWKIDPS
jgi:hypothetical protein